MTQTYRSPKKSHKQKQIYAIYHRNNVWIILFVSKLSLVPVGILVRNINLACPKELATEIWTDSDHSAKVESTALNLDAIFFLEALTANEEYAISLRTTGLAAKRGSRHVT